MSAFLCTLLPVLPMLVTHILPMIFMYCYMWLFLVCVPICFSCSMNWCANIASDWYAEFCAGSAKEGPRTDEEQETESSLFQVASIVFLVYFSLLITFQTMTTY